MTMERDSISLREYIDKCMADLKEAMDKLENSMSHRLESVNQFREQLNVERGTFVTKEVLDAKMETMVSARSSAIEKVEHDVEQIKSRVESLAPYDFVSSKHESLSRDLRALQEANQFTKGRDRTLIALLTAVPTVIAIVSLLVAFFG